MAPCCIESLVLKSFHFKKELMPRRLTLNKIKNNQPSGGFPGGDNRHRQPTGGFLGGDNRRPTGGFLGEENI